MAPDRYVMDVRDLDDDDDDTDRVQLDSYVGTCVAGKIKSPYR